MAKKKTINLAVPTELLDEFNRVCQQYGHAKQKGQVLSAAMLMFLRADPSEQGRCLEDVVGADITAGVARMIERSKREQGLRIATREATEKVQTDPIPPADSAESPEHRQAAKRAAQARQGLRDLPYARGQEKASPKDGDGDRLA